jgi:hypothetical protein
VVVQLELRLAGNPVVLSHDAGADIDDVAILGARMECCPFEGDRQTFFSTVTTTASSISSVAAKRLEIFQVNPPSKPDRHRPRVWSGLALGDPANPGPQHVIDIIGDLGRLRPAAANVCLDVALSRLA